MKNIKHNITTWFGGSKELLNFFESEFERNTIGTFKGQHTLMKRLNNDSEKAISMIGNTFISVILSLSQARILKTLPFNGGGLESDTQLELKQAVCDAIQHAIINKQVYERINGSSITTNSFQMNQDVVNWLMRSDVFGQYAKSALVNSGVAQYEWMEEDLLFKETANGNIKVIGKVDLNQVPDLTGGY